MPGEYKAAVVTSGEVRALISGDVVSISGVTVDVLVSGEVVLISGQPVLTSGEVALVSGQPVLVSGEVVIVSGQPVLISGQVVILSGVTRVATMANDDINRIGSVAMNDDNISVGGIAQDVLALQGVYNQTNDKWNRARAGGPVTMSSDFVAAAALYAQDDDVGKQRQLQTIGSGLPALAVGALSGQYVVVSGSVLADTSGQVALISGQPVLMSGQNVIISGQFVLVSGQPVLTSGEVALVSGQVALISGQPVLMSGEVVQIAGYDAAADVQRRLETIGSGEPILAVGHASGTRTISVSGQLIDSGGQTYTGVAVTFALGKYKRFAVFNTVTRSGASGQTVEVQVQFSEDAGTTWYDLVDGPFGALLYEGEQVGAVSPLRDVQTGKVAGGDLRIFIRTSGQTLDSNDNFTISSFVMLLN